MNSRFVLLHLHLFKNAGTSVDHILRDNFGAQWRNAEFSMERGGNTAGVSQWIKDEPDGIAFSSHTVVGPLPRLAGVRVIPILLLRDPVERIASAYRFERGQKADTRGAVLAKRHGFAGYVHARLSTPGDRQCANFQTARLAAMRPDIEGSERQRAIAAAEMIHAQGVLGLVSGFDAAMARLSALMTPLRPGFRWAAVTENATGGGAAQDVSPQMRSMLEDNNQDDRALLSHVRDLLGQAGTRTPVHQLAGMP